MDQKKPFLSVCIPTYNNADILSRTLWNITSDNFFLSSREVEVVVSDHCSSDHTESVVRSFASRLPGLVRYCRTPSRLVEENPCHALQAARGEYLKLLSDSSTIRSGCLGPWTTILKKLEPGRPIVFLVNEAPLEHEPSLTNGEDLEQFLATASHRCTDIDGFGIWREDLESMTDVARAASSKLFHVDLLLRMLEKKHRSVILRELILDRKRIDQPATYNIAEVYGENYLCLLRKYVESGALSKLGYDQEKRSVLVDLLLPLMAKPEHFCEIKNLEHHLRDYVGEDYFLPALQGLMRELSARQQSLSGHGSRLTALGHSAKAGAKGEWGHNVAHPDLLGVAYHQSAQKKFIFYTPHYDDNSGGSIAIYKLAHMLNQNGHVAKIWHWTRLHQNEIRVINGKVSKEFLIPSGISLVDVGCPYPVIEAQPEDVHDSIVVYPEIIEGNPLGAKKVVRWLLNKPGAITGTASFGLGDLILHYADHFLPEGMIRDDQFRIQVTDMKTHIYKDTYNGDRSGVYFMVRKARDIPLTYHPNEALQVDGMSHTELAALFSSGKLFISYDLHTAYSVYASLCGCDSVVVPRIGMTKEQWRAGGEQVDLDGIAYGFEDIERARSTRKKLISRVDASEALNLQAMEKFLRACNHKSWPTIR